MPFTTSVTLEEGLEVVGTVSCAEVGLAVVVGTLEEPVVFPPCGTVVTWHNGF